MVFSLNSLQDVGWYRPVRLLQNMIQDVVFVSHLKKTPTPTCKNTLKLVNK
jgi:hypothetical protein